MLTKTFLIGCEQGFHMRPAQVTMETASRFASKITIYHDEDETDAKSILGLMSLGLEKGSEIKVEADGSDEEEAMKAIEALVASNFGE